MLGMLPFFRVCGTMWYPKSHDPNFEIFGGATQYPLVMTNIAIENGHRNSEFSH